MTENATFEKAMTASEAFMATANRLPRLLSLSDETIEILYLLDSGEGDESELVARLEEVSAALAQKLDRAAWAVRDLDRLAAARKEEADKLREQSKRIESAAERLKALMLLAMQQTGQQRVETPRYTLRIQKNPPRVDVLEEQLVPGEFKRIVVTTTVDKRAILERVKQTGEVIDGVEIVRGERLVIG